LITGRLADFNELKMLPKALTPSLFVISPNIDLFIQQNMPEQNALKMNDIQQGHKTYPVHFGCSHTNRDKSEFVLTGVCLQVSKHQKRKKLN